MEYPTGIGMSDATSIHLLGHDLAGELLGHIAEELRHPIAPDIYAAIDRNAVYRPAASNDIPEQR